MFGSMKRKRRVRIFGLIPGKVTNPLGEFSAFQINEANKKDWVKESGREKVRHRTSLCVCLRERECVCVCVSVCVKERVCV